MKPEILRRWTIHIRHLSDVQLSWEIDIKLCQNYTKIQRYTILYKVVGLNRSYSANTQPIQKRLYPTGYMIGHPKKRFNFINQGQYNISIQNELNGDIIQRLTYSKIQYPRTTVLKYVLFMIYQDIV